MTKGKDSSVSVTREMMCWILTQEVRMQILEFKSKIMVGFILYNPLKKCMVKSCAMLSVDEIVLLYASKSVTNLGVMVEV